MSSLTSAMLCLEAEYQASRTLWNMRSARSKWPPCRVQTGARQWHSIPQHARLCQEGKAQHPLPSEDTTVWHVSFSNTANLSCVRKLDTDIQNFKKTVICLISSLVSFREKANYLFTTKLGLIFICWHFVLRTFRKRKKDEFHQIFLKDTSKPSRQKELC